MKLSGILLSLIAATSFGFAATEYTPLHCGSCESDKTEKCEDKKDCGKKKCADKEDCTEKECDKEKKKDCGCTEKCEKTEKKEA